MCRFANLTKGSLIRCHGPRLYGLFYVKKNMDVGWAANKPPNFSPWRQAPFEVPAPTKENWRRIITTLKPRLGAQQAQDWLYVCNREHRGVEVLQQRGTAR